MKSIAILAAAGALVVTPAVGAWAAFGTTDDNASHGTAQVRVDDRRDGGAPEAGDDHGRHHRHHGADDGARHHRDGADNRAGHQRHGDEAEPGDDHGRHGDDNGGRHGEDDGHHGGSDD